MSDRMDDKYYNSTNWRTAKGCANCSGFKADDLLIGGLNQCKNGKDNTNWHFYNCDAWTPNFEQGLLDRITTLEAENAELRERTRWIPVSSGELPKDNEDVLVVIDSAFTDYGSVHVAYHKSECLQWTTEHGLYFHGNEYERITHWMPLPEAPKGGEA